MGWGMRSPVHTPRIIILTLLDPPGRRGSTRQRSLLGPPSPPQHPQYLPCSRPKVPKSQRGKDLAGVPCKSGHYWDQYYLGCPSHTSLLPWGWRAGEKFPLDPHFL